MLNERGDNGLAPLSLNSRDSRISSSNPSVFASTWLELEHGQERFIQINLLAAFHVVSDCPAWADRQTRVVQTKAP
jgi:hypothetical protein